MKNGYNISIFYDNSIFYDTIFSVEGIYSRGWYLAKRNICQIKATQQQLHLKDCIVWHRPSRIFMLRDLSCRAWTCHRCTDYIVLWDTNSATVIRDSRPIEVPRIPFYETALTKKKGKSETGLNESDDERKTLTGMRDCETGQWNWLGLRSKTWSGLQDLLSQWYLGKKRVSECRAWRGLFLSECYEYRRF